MEHPNYVSQPILNPVTEDSIEPFKHERPLDCTPLNKSEGINIICMPPVNDVIDSLKEQLRGNEMKRQTAEVLFEQLRHANMLPCFLSTTNRSLQTE